MPSARSAALAIFASSAASSVVVKRTWPARVWRWMKVALSGAREQLLAVLRRHLDEIAEHVVVAHFQCAHAGLVGVTRLQRRDHAAGFVAQRARLVERRVVAGAHEAAVALEIAAGRRRAPRRAPPAMSAGTSTSACAAAANSSGMPSIVPQPPRELPRRRKARHGCRQIARSAAPEHEPRERAREVRRGAKLRAHVRRAPRRPRRTARPHRDALRSRPDR